eukprot:Em0010g116a
MKRRLERLAVLPAQDSTRTAINASKTDVVDRASVLQSAHIGYGEEVTNDVGGSGADTEEVERVEDLSSTEQVDEVEGLSDTEQVDEMEGPSDTEQVDEVEGLSLDADVKENPLSVTHSSAIIASIEGPGVVDLEMTDVSLDLRNRLNAQSLTYWKKIGDAVEQYGLLKSENGVWLDMFKSLEEYHLHDGDCLEFRSKMRLIRVRTLEDSIRVISVDGSHTVLEVTKTVCERIEKWLEPDRTLGEQGVTETTEITLRKKAFFSDGRVDMADLVQLNLIYVQSRNAILDGTLPCTKDEAIQLAALQYYIQSCFDIDTSNDTADFSANFCKSCRLSMPKAKEAAAKKVPYKCMVKPYDWSLCQYMQGLAMKAALGMPWNELRTLRRWFSHSGVQLASEKKLRLIAEEIIGEDEIRGAAYAYTPSLMQKVTNLIDENESTCVFAYFEAQDTIANFHIALGQIQGGSGEFSSITMEVCLPALHISMGIFYKLYSLLEEECHLLDLKLALQLSTDAELTTASYEEYATAVCYDKNTAV